MYPGNSVRFQTQKSKPNLKKSGRYGHFGLVVRVVLRRTEEGTGELASCGILVHLLRADHDFGAASARGYHHIRFVGSPTQTQRLVRAEPGKAFAFPGSARTSR